MKCLCIGICQIVSISEILKKSKLFTSIYDEILCYTIFTITAEEMKDLLENVVPTCDLILSQPVSDNYRGSDLFSTKLLRQKKKEGAKHFIISNCYFTGYDPIPFQTVDQDGNTTNVGGISYYPSVSLTSLLNGNIVQSCIDWNQLNTYSDEDIQYNYKKSIDELKKRENKVFDNDYGVDIKISDFIETNYQSKYLFHTYNHPTNILLLELTRRIVERLGLVMENVTLDRELLGDNSMPPPFSVYLKSNMTFRYPSFVIANVEYKNTRSAMTQFVNNLKHADPSDFERWRSTISYGRYTLAIKK